MRCAGANLILKKLWNTFQRLRPEEFSSEINEPQYLRIGKSVFVFEFVFVFVEWAFTVNLRPKKTPQAEISGGISGRKLLRPKPLESVPPQFFCPSPPPLPPPSPSNKAGWAYRSKLLRDKFLIDLKLIFIQFDSLSKVKYF